jgi:hypothetical protein
MTDRTPTPSGCTCEGGVLETFRYPSIVNPDCAVHGSATELSGDNQ